ncbi:hypothetical protein GCM10010359_17830 [Streptomyces morookaense]|nr:hypothetical protein GCM10010359_17830 [Streptomyces morookaense]
MPPAGAAIGAAGYGYGYAGAGAGGSPTAPHAAQRPSGPTATARQRPHGNILLTPRVPARETGAPNGADPHVTGIDMPTSRNAVARASEGVTNFPSTAL